MTTLSAQAAIDLLISDSAKYSTPEALRNLAAQVATESPGRVTVLYSGSIGGGISSNTLIEGMLSQGEDIRVINRTEVAEFLNSRAFKTAVADAFGVDIRDVDTRGNLANDFLYDPTKGTWAEASARFAAGATGDVRIIAPLADYSRTLVQVELLKILQTPEVTSINGVSKTVFQSIFDKTGSITEVGKAVSTSSYSLMGEMEFHSYVDTNADGTPKLNSDGSPRIIIDKVNSTSLFEGLSYEGTSVPADELNTSVRTVLDQSLSDERATALGEGLRNLSTGARAVMIAEGTVKGLGVLGIGLTAVRIVDMGDQAQKAYNAGDTDKAAKILIDGSLEISGGWAGGIAASAFAAGFFAYLVPTGPVGDVAYIVLVATFGIGGAVFGEKAVKSLLEGQSGESATTTENGVSTTTYSNGVVFSQNLSATGNSDSGEIIIRDRQTPDQRWIIPNSDGDGTYTEISRDLSQGVTHSRVWSGDPKLATSQILKEDLFFKTHNGSQQYSYENGELVSKCIYINNGDEGLTIKRYAGSDGSILSSTETIVPVFDHLGNRVDILHTKTVFNTNGPADITVFDGSGNETGHGTLVTNEDGSTSQTINYLNGTTTRINTDSEGLITSRTDTVPSQSGSVSTTHIYETGTTVRSELDASGNLLVRTVTVTSATGLADVTVYDGANNEIGCGTLVINEDGSTSQTINYSDGRIVRTDSDSNGMVTSQASIQYFEEDGISIETVTYADGRVVKLTYDSDGNLLNQEAVSSGGQALLNAIGQYGGPLLDALSLVKAIQNGEPLPVVASSLKVANDLSILNGTPNLNLSGAAYAASGILSLMSLDAALERDDALGALTAGAQTVTFCATAYANFAGEPSLSAAINAGTFGEATGALTVVSEALPYLSIINSIAHGDMVGAAVGVVALSFPVIGWAYAVYSIISCLFSDEPEIPDPWGNGHYVWNGNAITYQAAGETGGKEAVDNVMNSTLATLNALIERERQQNPGSQLGIIPNRMPSVGYDMSGYRYTDIDPLTGAEKHPALRFDTSGRPYNADVGSPESYQSIVEGMVRSALSRGAIAPLWEVQTAKKQTDAGDPKAGLTEEERAGRDGQLAAPLTGSSQIFRPVALDLDGDGIEVTDKAHGVAFDVDDSGYLKQTAWVKGDDALLVLDRNYNGQFDSGKELFSNGAVALSRRGLAGMAWVDSNYDGKLTADDPVWNELKLWRDLDHDGQQEGGEVQTLEALGITELNYAMSTFTQSGVKKHLGSPDLDADSQGTRISVIPEGILVQSSENGHLSLLVTRIDDKTAVEANRDGVTGFEDVEIIVSGADLLANDSLGGILGRDLSITGLTNFRHGTGFIDPNGFVHFTPEANYAGDGAGFDYVAQAQNGQTGTSTVDVTLKNVNDAPTLDHVDHTSKAVYGYTPLVYSSDGRYQSGGNPIYSPYSGQTAPIATEDSGVGRVNGVDMDDPASSLTYEIVSLPQYGGVSLNADGTFQYTSWKEPGVPSDRIVYNGQYAGTKDGTLYYPDNLPSQAVYPKTDVFQVKITDPQGASTIQSISVPHYGPYLPATPEGGGGGGKKPIAVDLSGNGFEFVNVDDSNVFFDVNGDGWKRRTSWVGKDDGLLAYDIDGDGKIDKPGEISFTRYKEGAQSDLEGLRAFDSNGDGRFDAADGKWAKFGVWQDANQNGVADPGEFRTLAEMGVTSVNLTSDGHFQVINGQTVHGMGSMTKADGSQMAIADVTFAYSNETQIPQGDGTTQTVSTSPFSPNGEEIVGTEGKDLILGKNGNNIVKGLGGDDVIFEDGGNDIIDGCDGNDLIYSGADNDLVMGGAGDDVIYAGLGSDVVFGGDGHDAIFAEGGNDVVFGGEGNDLVAGGNGNDVLSGDKGDDQIYGESGNDALFGGAGNDELSGMDGNDRLDGGTGNDLLNGGSGADEMIGGVGDDRYVVDDTADTVTELANEGNDTVLTTLDGYTLGANVENLTLTGSADFAARGNEVDNVLIGNRGNNTLIGFAGNDKLDGGLGADTLIGGTGDDAYVVDNAGDSVVERVGEGLDTVKASVSFKLTANVENLTLTGTGNIDATGNELDNRLTGNTGDNRLDGGAGADVMTGGLGNDIYVVDLSGDVVTENIAAGIDTVISSINYVLGENVENLTLSGTGDLHGSGNKLDNEIVGNAGNNVLDGGVGTDTLVGGAGNDTYVVDSFGDTIIEQSGEGIDSVQTSISYMLASNVENLLLLGSADINGVGNDLDNQLTGNAGNNRLFGGTGNDTYVFAQGFGNDVIFDHDLKAGNVDTLRFTDLAPEDLLVGIDGNDLFLEIHGRTDTLRIKNGAQDAGIGADAIERIEFGDGTVWSRPELWQRIVMGTPGNDTLTGLVFSETFYAQGGDDSIDAGGGHDTAYCGDGNDFVKGGSGDDRLYGQNGDDRLYGDDGNDYLNGGAGNDQLFGGAGRDTLDGGEGWNDDMLAGGSGADTYRWGIGKGFDTIVEANGGMSGDDVLELDPGLRPKDLRVLRQGNDLLLNTADNANWLRVQNHFTDEGRLELIRFADGSTWTAADLADVDWRHTIARADGAVSGNGLNEVIKGGEGDDMLDGAGGDDEIRAGTGDDVAYGGTGNDKINGGDGNDWLSGGQGDDQLTDTLGNSLADGGDGNDWLMLGAGNDIAIGGRGDDSIALGDGADLLLFNRGDGLDRVTAAKGGDNAISLGGTRYADLSLERWGSDLVLGVGANDRIVLGDWYGATGATVSRLQLVTEGTDNYIAGSSKPLSDHKIEQFDFGRLVAAFEQSNNSGSRWNLMNSLLDAHLEGSDSAALGGELASAYAREGSLTAVGAAGVQTVLQSSNIANQTLSVGSGFDSSVKNIAA